MKQETYSRINICIACDSHRNKTALAIKLWESILTPLWLKYLRIPSVCSVTDTRVLTTGSGLFSESSLHSVWIENSVKALQLSIERLHISLRGRFTFLTLLTVDVFALIVFTDKPGKLCGFGCLLVSCGLLALGVDIYQQLGAWRYSSYSFLSHLPTEL